MAVCDSCKREVGDGMGFCPFCGADLPAENENPSDEAPGEDTDTEEGDGG
jgi:rRNA maturation endonuclease Nob1